MAPGGLGKAQRAPAKGRGHLDLVYNRPEERQEGLAERARGGATLPTKLQAAQLSDGAGRRQRRGDDVGLGEQGNAESLRGTAIPTKGG